MIASLDFLNVYQAGQTRTVFIGLTRVVTIVIFGLGVMTVAPRMYFDPDVSMWWVPTVAIGSAVPLVVLAMLSAPYVSTIRILLPASAKRNHQTLMAFAENVPADTKVLLQSMRWLPWPQHKQVFFSDLRRLSGRKISVNLEHVPLGHDQAKKANQTIAERLLVRMYGRYWVDMTATNKSQAPGVWEKMWDQITIKGQESLKVAPKDRLPPVMANRSAPVTPSVGAGRKTLPPPPPPPVRSKGGAKSKKRSR